MAVPKEKVVTALTAKLAGKNVSKKLIDGYATRWADRIQTEEEIDAYVDDRFEDVNDAQKEADRRANLATKAAKDEATAAITGKKPETETKPADEVPEGTPEWMKPVLQQMKALNDKVAGFEKAKTTETLTERFKNHEKIKGIPDALLKGYIPDSEEGFEAAVESAHTALKPYADKLGLADFGKDTPTSGGVQKQKPGTVKEATKEELDAVMAQL